MGSNSIKKFKLDFELSNLRNYSKLILNHFELFLFEVNFPERPNYMKEQGSQTQIYSRATFWKNEPAGRKKMKNAPRAKKRG